MARKTLRGVLPIRIIGTNRCAAWAIPTPANRSRFGGVAARTAAGCNADRARDKRARTMPIIQDNTTIPSAWMEHKVLEHIKQALRVTLDWRAPDVGMPRKLSSLQFTSKSLQRHLERLMRIEEEGGYMSSVLEMKPHLQARIAVLAGDHQRFRNRLANLIADLEGLHEWEEPRFHELCQELRGLLADIDAHDAQEVGLLQQSLLEVEGGEG
jgi:hypothetical protein